MANCSIENMDEVSFNLPTSNLFVLNGQTVLFQNGSISTQENNGDALHEELFTKESTPKQLTTELERVQENTFEGGGFVIVKGPQKENECNLIQLTVQEAANLGIQFSVDNNTPKNTNLIELQSTKSPSLIFQKVDETLEDANKLTESASAVNYLTSDNLSDVSKIPCVSKNLNEFAIVPQYVNGQIAYAVQLSGTDQIQTSQNISIPISVPTMEVQPVTPAESDYNIYLSPVTVKSVVNNPSKKTDATRSGTSQQNYVPYPKVRIMSKVRNNELKKSNQRKVMPTSKDKYINRQRKLAPQKLFLPPLNKTEKKEGNTENKLFRTNAIDPTDSLKKALPTNDQDTASLNQSLLQVFKNSEELNGNSSSENIKTILTNQLPNDKGNDYLAPKVKEVQVLTVPQGSKTYTKNTPVPKKLSGRKLTPSQLRQIAALLQKNRHNRPSDISNASTLYDLETNTRIICRVLYPEDLTSEAGKAPAVSNVKKRGRSNKKEKIDIGKEEKLEKGKAEKSADRVPARTRSGRVTRPPRHMVEDYKRLKGDDSDGTYSDYQSGTDENIENSPAVNLLPGLNHQKRKFSSKFRCPTCNKIYLGYVRMALHFTKYPDHFDSKQLELLKESANANEDCESGTGEGGKTNWKKGVLPTKGKGKAHRKILGRFALDKVLDSYNENEVKRTCGRRVASMLTTWDMLLLRLDNKEHAGKCKVQAFLDELESFVKSVRAVSHQILRQPNCVQPDIQLADDTICSLLGMDKGWYSSDVSGLPQPLVKDQSVDKHNDEQNGGVECCTNDCSLTEAQLLLCKDEQDVVQVKEELSELDLLCVQDDPIGVDSVDQIVSERLKTMAPVDDLVSTLPAMPATSTDELVRGLLTDDLINSLETLIPPTHTPPDLDFTVLSTDFNSSR